MLQTLSEVIGALNKYWSDNGYAILHPYSSEMGAATLSPLTILHTLIKKEWRIGHTQVCSRPADGRYGKGLNRLYQHHQYQIISKPSPENFCEIYSKSIEVLGINEGNCEIRFIPDLWENPSVGAMGYGYEVWCNGQEISQITYMQQIGGIECDVIPVEIAYGIERICLILQNIDNVYDIVWDKNVSYGDLFRKSEYEFSCYAFEETDPDFLNNLLVEYKKNFLVCLQKQNCFAAYDLCMRASHILNLLDALGVIGNNERASHILQIREMVQQCCKILIKCNETL